MELMRSLISWMFDVSISCSVLLGAKRRFVGLKKSEEIWVVYNWKMWKVVFKK